MGRLILRLLGVAAIAVAIVIFEIALSDIIDLPSCSDILARAKPPHTACAPGTTEAILRIVGSALLFFIGLALDALGRQGRDGIGIVLPLAIAGFVAAVVVALWPDHTSVALLIVIPGAFLAAIIAVILTRSHRRAS